MFQFNVLSFLAILATAAAFMTTPKIGTRSIPTLGAVFNRDGTSYVENMAGVVEPTGFFDPLGLSASIDDPKVLKKWRESELKQGRIAMLACAGFFVQERFIEGKIPALGVNYILGPAIYHFQQINNLVPWFWGAVLFSIALVECYNINIGWEAPGETMRSANGVAMLKESYENGDLGFDPLNLKPKNAQELKRMQTRELQNGRLAMIGVAGIIAQEFVTNNKVF